MIASEQAFLVPQNLDEAETLVNKLTIEDLRVFSSAPVDVERRINNLEFVVSQMREYTDESLKQFRVSLTEPIKESTERMMRIFDKPSDGDTRIDLGPN